MKEHKAILGLDLELSGVNPAAGHVPVQLGLSVMPSGRFELMECFSSIVGWSPEELIADDSAMLVHGIAERRIYEAPRASQVDTAAVSWLDEVVGECGPHSVIACGWGITKIDLPVVSRFFPKLSSRLSDMPCELHSVAMLVAAATGPSYGDAINGLSDVKRAAQRYSGNMLGVGERHDAGYDASAALLEFDWLTRALVPA